MDDGPLEKWAGYLLGPEATAGPTATVTGTEPGITLEGAYLSRTSSAELYAVESSSGSSRVR